MIMSNRNTNNQKLRYRLNRISVFIAAILFSGIFQFASAQQSESELLSTRPHFLDSADYLSDSLFREDMKIIGKYIELDSVDRQMFRPSVLLMLIRNNSNASQILDYNALIGIIKDFRKGIGYTEMRKAIMLYSNLADRRVNPKNWDLDQQLFVRLGFTQADIEDFKLFISMKKNRKKTYRQAYIDYMKEIDSLK